MYKRQLYNSFGRRLREISCAAYTAVINHNASLIDDAGYILDDDALARTAQDAPVPHMVPGGRARSPVSYTHLDVYKRQVFTISD